MIQTQFHHGLAALAALAALGLGCESKPAPQSPAAPQQAGDLDALAERLIGENAAVREGELVQVNGTTADAPLMEALAVAIRRRGAFPLLTLTSDALAQRLYTKVPEQYDAQPPKFELALAEAISVLIDLVPESDIIYPGVAPERIAKVQAGRHDLHVRHRERGIRQIALGNEVYPSRARAERYSIPYPVLERSYWRGIAVDGATLEARAAWLRDKLARARKIEVTNPNGTHLTLSVTDRPMVINDGRLRPEKVQAGAGLQVWLPAGELFVAPVARSVQGTVVVDRLLFQDTRIEGLRVDFVDGKVAKLSAKTGFDALQRYYDAAPPGKELFSALDIGINPNVEHAPGSWLTSSVASGMITLGFGRNTWAGGDNDVAFGVLLYVPGSTLLADGERLIADGVLALPPSGK